MPHSKTVLALAFVLTAGGAEAGDWSNSASYNGYAAASQNTASNFNLRDANGNLTMVDGQSTSSNFSQNSGVQTASGGGVGMVGAMSGAGMAYGTATAIGNSLNVVTVGSNNTVIVNSTQTNTGNQTASANLSGH